MLDAAVQEILIDYILKNAPLTFASEMDALLAHYSGKVPAARDIPDLRRVVSEYRSAKAALVVRLAREISVNAN